MRTTFIIMLGVGMTVTSQVPAAAQDTGRAIYMRRCWWCHGEDGRGAGPSAIGMFPRPRDFVRADYKVRSTPEGQPPTDEDLFRVIATGLPGTPMDGWEGILTEQEIRSLVAYLVSLSPRFTSAPRAALALPSAGASAQRGEELYVQARCFTCHGTTGRGDGGTTVALNFEWGLPHVARDLTRGWTFKGGHEPGDIYLRITTGLAGTPMGSYRDLLTDQERWDLAHYVASLDSEPVETSEQFVLAASYTADAIPDDPDAAEWSAVPSILVPLAGQIVSDTTLRWRIPTAGSADLQAVWNDAEIGILLAWTDPTGPGTTPPDSAFIQLGLREGSKPYFLLGDADDPVALWNWFANDEVEEWSAAGAGDIKILPVTFRAAASWTDGRWRVLFRRSLVGEPAFEVGRFVPVLVSLRDGANGERGDVRAVSTWLYATLEQPRSVRSLMLALAYALGTVLVAFWTLGNLRS